MCLSIVSAKIRCAVPCSLSTSRCVCLKWTKEMRRIRSYVKKKVEGKRRRRRRKKKDSVLSLFFSPSLLLLSSPQNIVEQVCSFLPLSFLPHDPHDDDDDDFGRSGPAFLSRDQELNALSLLLRLSSSSSSYPARKEKGRERERKTDSSVLPICTHFRFAFYLPAFFFAPDNVSPNEYLYQCQSVSRTASVKCEIRLSLSFLSSLFTQFLHSPHTLHTHQTRFTSRRQHLSLLLLSSPLHYHVLRLSPRLLCCSIDSG